MIVHSVQILIMLPIVDVTKVCDASLERLVTRRVMATLAVLLSASSAVAAPICPTPTRTLAERFLEKGKTTLLVEWVTTAEGIKKNTGNTVFRVVENIHGPAGDFKIGQNLVLPWYLPAKKTELFLVTGIKKETMRWDKPLKVTKACYQYVKDAPAPEKDFTERLSYYLEFLEHDEEVIAKDAYSEFGNASYDDIASLAKIIPRDEVREWLFKDKAPIERSRIYGLMLGVCGNEQDAHDMATRIAEPAVTFRSGIDGIMCGYLLLTGDKGLAVIEETKMRSRYIVGREGEFILDKNGEKQTLAFSETYAAMMALRFMWHDGQKLIGRERLRQSMRILIPRSELADLVIYDLARWKDWSSMDQIFKLYDDKQFDIPSIKRAIVRFLLTASQDFDPDDNSEPPDHASKAKSHLAKIKAQDPKLYREVLRFFPLRPRKK